MNRFMKALARRVLLLTSALALMSPAAQADMKLDELKTSGGTFYSVTVFNRTKTHLSFSHSGGVAVIKLSDLDEAALASLDGEASSPGAVTEGLILNGKNESANSSYAPAFDGAQLKSFAAALAGNPVVQQTIDRVGRTFLIGMLVALFVGWLFYSFCCSLICKKAGHEPGIVVWIPVFQLIPLIQAARMSGWWFLAWFVPALNIIAAVLWCIKIADARGKSPWVGVCLILPITNIFAFLYLAFSNGHQKEEAPSTPLGAPRVVPA